jgi:hypothetical protein
MHVTVLVRCSTIGGKNQSEQGLCDNKQINIDINWNPNKVLNRGGKEER